MMRWLVLSLVLGGCLKDIRPKGFVDDPALEESARARLQAVAERHGLVEWQTKERLRLTVHDEWYGVYGAASPWPRSQMRADMVMIPGTFSSAATFLTGPEEGVVWTMDKQGPSSVSPSGAPAAGKDKRIAFILPTIQYFLDLPFRLSEADIVRPVPQASVDGVMYERLFVTWESVKPNKRFDQYLVFVHPETGLIDKVQYTVRDANRFISGTSHYADYREVQGVMLPSRMTVTTTPEQSPEPVVSDKGVKRKGIFHEVRFEYPRFYPLEETVVGG